MTKQMTNSWSNRHGTWRVRNEPASVAEAMEAARDIALDEASQMEFAASLMNMTPDEVKAALPPRRSHQIATVAIPAGRTSQQSRAVIVERVGRRQTAR